jgi:hypothetical protein
MEASQKQKIFSSGTDEVEGFGTMSITINISHKVMAKMYPEPCKAGRAGRISTI